MRNVEAKFRCEGDLLSAIRERALGLGARAEGTVWQTDTYFQVLRGRLKLREVGEEGRAPSAVLIGYERPDRVGARASDYTIAAVPDAKAVLAALDRTIGVRSRVQKRREVLLLRHTRIHLDAVQNLGTYVELETVVGESDAWRGGPPGADDPAAAERELQEIAAALGLPLTQTLAGSYADLLDPEHHGADAASGGKETREP